MMEQTQVQQLQLQGAVDALKGVVDALLQDKMNLSAQNYILGAQLKTALETQLVLEKQIEALNESKKEKEIPAEASSNESK